ncbi:MAG: class I SAM-dependent methyltransferase [Pseudomonadota bacterium]
MSTDPETISFYDTNAAAYAEFAIEVTEHPKLVAFANALPPGARVLDLGCGVGWAAAALRDLGFAVDAQDASTGLAAEAKTRFDLDVRVAPFDALEAEGYYDGVFCHFALQHTPVEAREDVFGRIARALKPKGVFYAGVQSDPEPWRDEISRLYNPFSHETLRTLCAQVGMTVEKIETGQGKGYDGRPSENAYLWARHG